VACRTHDKARHRDHRDNRSRLRHLSISLTPQRSILVPGLRRSDGNGLALLRNHDLRDGCTQTRPRTTRKRAGLYVCGGRGRFSRNTPNELRALADQRGFDGDALVRTSRLTARIDNNAIADGFQIYLHSFVVTSEGEWAVVQQGLNDQNGLARRYHWHSASVLDFVADPHTAIFGENQGEIMNLVDAKADRAQNALLEIANERPEKTVIAARHLRLPAHHDVREKDVDLKRLGAVLAVAYDKGLQDFTELLLLEKLGPRTLQSLALVAEVVHGAPSRFNDPARFAFAHGGKDGHPHPVPLKTYDESLGFLRKSLDAAKLGHTDKLDGFRRLDRFVRMVETQPEPRVDIDALIRHENAISPLLDGRTVFDERRRRVANPRQGSLF